MCVAVALLGSWLRVFDGSARELMLHALAGHRSSKTEIEELRRLLDEHERKLR